ncbi:alpha/beta hydrolase [Streptosporangium sp. 'caverna']|uniref:alpha/beta hydrolase n=1 Tax=Streptosporangium sp. 'caverna' TaxID=2202249 RepID=UPI0019550214|nr:alpha/beta hydrolase [Streptosporangium sp. 'caverna']
MRKPVLIGVLLALLLPLLAAPPTAAASAIAPPAASAAITWTPCAENSAVECGTLTLPVDWNAPTGETFELALARRKATDPAARIGSLVVNPGGPGSSGVRAVFEETFGFTSELTSRFDIVGFDPRGVGRSHPILCSVALAGQAPEVIMRSQADFDRWLAYNEQVRQDCRARTGPLFDHVDTGSVVRDLDALRAALGDDKLTYYGLSHGTLLGQQYAERFPHRVRALALDSNLDHSLDTTAFLKAVAWTAQDSFDEFVTWCAKDTACALHGQDVRAFWGKLRARADRGELHMPGQPDTPLPRMTLENEVIGAFYGPYWKELAEVLVAIDTSTATPQLMPAAPAPAEETYNNTVQIMCQDFDLPIHDYREYYSYLRTAAKIAPDMRYGPRAMSLTVNCLGQPTPIPNPQRRLHVDAPLTLLLVNALHDPATGYPWAVSTARQIGREARLLTYEGWGHHIYGRGECVTSAFDRYLVSLTVPAKGARCAAVPPDQASSYPARFGPKS